MKDPKFDFTSRISIITLSFLTSYSISGPFGESKNVNFHEKKKINNNFTNVEDLKYNFIIHNMDIMWPLRGRVITSTTVVLMIIIAKTR